MNSNDRAILKKKMKEIKCEIEKEKRALEREQKAKVKLLKKRK